MNLFINDKALTASSNISLDELMIQLGHKSQPGIAVAVNQTIIQKNDWSSTTLAKDDQIIIIRATQGG